MLSLIHILGVMDNNDVVKLYEKEIEIFLGTMGIFKGAKICNTAVSYTHLDGRLLLLWRFSAVSARPGQGGSWNRQAPAVADPFSRSASFPPASAL